MLRTIFTVAGPVGILFIAGCASIHSGNYAEPIGAGTTAHSSETGIVIGGLENDELSSKYFAEVDVTFENRSADWIRIKNVTVDFENPALNQGIKVPVGSDLLAWASAAETNKQIHDYNTSLVLGSVLAIGSVAATTSHNQSIGAAGGVLALGALGGIAVTAIHDDKEKAELAKLVPPSHLMSDEFVIPPGLHAKKWITFYTRDPHGLPAARVMTLVYTMENGKTERARLKFRSPTSPWEMGWR